MNYLSKFENLKIVSWICCVIDFFHVFCFSFFMILFDFILIYFDFILFCYVFDIVFIVLLFFVF
jgi:hypothetical protein